MVRRDGPEYANLEMLALGAVLVEEAAKEGSDAASTRAFVLSRMKDTDFASETAKKMWAWILEQQGKGLPVALEYVPHDMLGYASICIERWYGLYGNARNIKKTCDEMARITDLYYAHSKVKSLFHNLNFIDDMETAHVVLQLREVADSVAAQHPEVVEDVVTVSDALHSYMSLWGKLSPRLCFGLWEIDSTIRGFRAPNIVVIAGRTNTGKSAIWIPIAIENARKGKRVLIVSTEMDRNAMTKRMIANIGNIKMASLDSIEDGDIDTMVLNETRILDAHKELSSLPITMNDKCRTVGEIDDLCRQAEANGNPYSLIIIDYIQLLRPTKTFITKTEIPMSIVSSELKAIASARNVAIVALSQLNRAAMTEGKEPELHHLAQSGSLENDADMVLLMHRPEKDDPKHIHINLAKNRHGGYGRWDLSFEGDTMRYYAR